MNCKTARVLMSAAVDGELTGKEEEGLRLHLADCSDCRREFEEAKKTKMIVKEKIVRFKAPQSLIDSIMDLSFTMDKKEKKTLISE
ncbi:anti-sigma factor [Chlorobium sp. N1]|uniref:anti-sigma factor n=1 Tax=Chlorobium sp. N1 TaxID=2491138 RepID=UPI00103B5F59|nr:anti-sigma factor [Chlorobium sp. N1]TCD47364.1 zf-HC2 domain-containing protein [Chlorobium sp. N1]